MALEEDRSLAEFMGEQGFEQDWTGVKQNTQYFTHGLHSYPARMPPHISRRLLRLYSESANDKILDPYCGSGGVLLESMLYDRCSVGIDINPLAVLIARVKTTPIEMKEIAKTRSKLVSNILERIKMKEDPKIPEIKNVNFWFKPKAQKELAIIKYEIDRLKTNKEMRDFFSVCFSLTVRKASNLKTGQFKLYGKQGKELEIFEPKAFENFSKITFDNMMKMNSFAQALKEFREIEKPTIILGDTKKLLQLDPDKINEETFKLVITSPPYGDSHTTVAYGQFSRYSSLWLGFGEKEVYEVDEKGLGGKVLNKRTSLGSDLLDEIISRIDKSDPYRAREVYAYFHDADECLSQIPRTLIQEKSHCCYVIANRTVRRVKIPTDEIFIQLGKKYGLKHQKTIHREIPNKVVPQVNAPENISGLVGETMTKESIIIWSY